MVLLRHAATAFSVHKRIPDNGLYDSASGVDWGGARYGLSSEARMGRSVRLLRQMAVGVVLLFLPGCSTWSPAASSSSSFDLPRPQMSPDSVVLEIAIVHFPESADEGQWWQQVDEQALPHEMRQRLIENGLRCGIIRGALPDALRDQLESQRAAVQAVDPENSPGGSPGGEQRLQSRSGKRNKILISDVQPSLAVLVPKGNRLTGQTLTDAQCVFSVKSFSRGDGRADLEVTPEIEHGQARQKWLGQAHEGTFRLDANRERLILESLRIRPTLSPGQMLAITVTSSSKGLGRQFCVANANGPPERRVLLIRLAQTQLDDLFTDGTSQDPLTTPLE